MTPAESYSEKNILESISLYLAGQLLAAGYLVYWHRRDAVQTPAGTWYFQYSQNYKAYLADAGFAAIAAAAKGLVTMTDTVPAEPRFLTRPIVDGSVPGADTIMVPSVAVGVGPAVALGDYELGSSRLKWRDRALTLDAFVRTDVEQRVFKDGFALWFDEESLLEIKDHAAGNLAVVGDVEVLDPRVDHQEVFDDAEAKSFEVLLNARLEYVA